MKVNFNSLKLFQYFLCFILSTFLISCKLFNNIGANETYKNRKLKKNTSPTFTQKGNIKIEGNNQNTNNPTQDNISKNDSNYSFNNIARNEYNLAYTNDLRLKYAKYFGQENIQKINLLLLENIDEWYGTPYKIGGKSKSGIDCSGFTNIIYSQVYNITLNNYAASQYEQCRSINYEDLKEGDLVFFKSSRRISHVGIYISNNKFVHASTSQGVSISDLNDSYWKRRIYAFARVN